ncbi:chaperonin 10-like protein [Aspergillus heterothallicus]
MFSFLPAYVVHGPKSPFQLETIYLDEIRDNELLIEITHSGICHTDLVMQQGVLPWLQFPAVLGHEGAGIIRKIGRDVRDKDLKLGDAVLLSFNTCGGCQPCHDDRLAFCRHHAKVNHSAIRVSDGSTAATLSDGRLLRSQYFGQSSFARHSVVPERSVIKCPVQDADLSVYAPIGCGYQTGAGTILNIIKPKPSDVLAIFGLGGVGLSCILAARFAGVQRILAVDVAERKLEIARELGATDTLNPGQCGGDIVAALKKATGDSISFAFDCTGVPRVIEQCIESCGPEGTAVGLGVPPAGATAGFNALEMMLQHKRYIGVVAGAANPYQLIPRLIEMHKSGNFPLEKLRTVYPATQLNTAIADLKNGRVIKPVISWEK